MTNRYKRITKETLMNEIYKAKKMVAYTAEFEDKTAEGRWKMVVFQLECLYEKLNTAFWMIQHGDSDETIKDTLEELDKQLFMEGP